MPESSLKVRLSKSRLVISMLIGEIPPENEALIQVLRETKCSISDAIAYIDANQISAEIEDMLRGENSDNPA